MSAHARLTYHFVKKESCRHNIYHFVKKLSCVSTPQPFFSLFALFETRNQRCLSCTNGIDRRGFRSRSVRFEGRSLSKSADLNAWKARRVAPRGRRRSRDAPAIRAMPPSRADGAYARSRRGGAGWLSASLGCAVADTIFNPLEVAEGAQASRDGLCVRLRPRSRVDARAGAGGDPRAGRVARFVATRPRGDRLPRLHVHRVPDRLVPRGARRDRQHGAFGGGDAVAARVAAGAAGAIGSALFNPIDVVRIRMQGPAPYAPLSPRSRRSPGARASRLWLAESPPCVARAASSPARSSRRTTPRSGVCGATIRARRLKKVRCYISRRPRLWRGGADGDAARGHDQDAGPARAGGEAAASRKTSAPGRWRASVSRKRAGGAVPGFLAGGGAPSR